MEFYSPKFSSEAFDILDKNGKDLKIVAGMTHLLRCYPNFPQELSMEYKGFLHIGELQALADCKEENNKYVIGSTATISQLAADSYLARYATAVIEAARITSTPQIRHRRTVGGELAWGSYHSPLICALLAMEAKLRIRFCARDAQQPGHEDTLALNEFYSGERTRESARSAIVTRKSKIGSQDLILKVVLPAPLPGGFSFFKALIPKIHTENSGIVVAVSGTAQNGTILSARMVASGSWMSQMEEVLPLDGTRMSDTYIYERLYTFCERYSFDNVRRSGPPAAQMGQIVFGLLKEGFSGLLGR